MIGYWWVLPLVACALFPVLLGKVLGAARNFLPRDFDFDMYKNRELSLRGLFDKTKWT